MRGPVRAPARQRGLQHERLFKAQALLCPVRLALIRWHMNVPQRLKKCPQAMRLADLRWYRVRHVCFDERIEHGSHRLGDAPRRGRRCCWVNRDRPGGFENSLISVGRIHSHNEVIRVNQLPPAPVVPHRAREEAGAARAQLVLMHPENTGALGEEGQLKRVATVRHDRLEHRSAARTHLAHRCGAHFRDHRHVLASVEPGDVSQLAGRAVTAWVMPQQVLDGVETELFKRICRARTQQTRERLAEDARHDSSTPIRIPGEV